MGGDPLRWYIPAMHSFYELTLFFCGGRHSIFYPLFHRWVRIMATFILRCMVFTRQRKAVHVDVLIFLQLPMRSMCGMFTYIYHIIQPNVGKYTIHGSFGLCLHLICAPSSYWYLLVLAGMIMTQQRGKGMRPAST